MKEYYSRNLEQKKGWYSQVAEIYDRARPNYPQKLIDRVVTLAQLPAKANILEIGCGSGKATLGFARLGFSLFCLEPNREFLRLVKQNCANYPKVKIDNTSFEEWQLETEKFDAVVAANVFHWLDPQIAYTKSAEALKPDGCLILLWNLSPQPDRQMYNILREVYRQHAPALDRYENRQTQEKIVSELEQNIVNSGCFNPVISEYTEQTVTYSSDRYIMLLGSFSPYIALDSQQRDLLFLGIRKAIERNGNGKIQLRFLSAFNLARKI